jgi:hypothetical protein
MLAGVNFRGSVSTILRDTLEPGFLLQSSTDQNLLGKVVISDINVNDINNSINQTPNKVIISDNNGALTSSVISNIELTYLSNQNMNIRNNFQLKQNRITINPGDGLSIFVEPNLIRKINTIPPLSSITNLDNNTDIGIDLLITIK